MSGQYKAKKVLALTDNLENALRIWQGVGDSQTWKLYLIVADEDDLGALRWWVKFFLQWMLGGGWTRRRLVLKLLATGRLCLLGRPLHHPASIKKIFRMKPDMGLHGAHVIYRKSLIECFSTGILNAHIGKLPEYRGRSVMEWSLLEGAETGISTFVIDEGIDTGRPVVDWHKIDLRTFRTIFDAKNYLFSQDVKRFSAILEANMLRDIYPEKNEKGRRFYVMSKLFEGVVENMLEQQQTSLNETGNVQ